MMTRMQQILITVLVVLTQILSVAHAESIVTYYHTDIVGSPIAATNESGVLLWEEQYQPYGERRYKDEGSGDNRLWFSGKPQDEATGLSYYGARHYDPVVGRFMGIDPVGFRGG